MLQTVPKSVARFLAGRVLKLMPERMSKAVTCVAKAVTSVAKAVTCVAKAVSGHMPKLV
ncbi:MAG: hypothetical protein ACREE2_04215 [Stellaceae bacterium]